MQGYGGCKVIIGIPLAGSVSECMCVWVCVGVFVHFLFLQQVYGRMSRVPPHPRRSLGGRELRQKRKMGWASSGDGLLRAKVKRWGQDQDAEEPQRVPRVASCCLQDYFGTYWSSSRVNKRSRVRGGQSEYWIKSATWIQDLNFFPPACVPLQQSFDNSRRVKGKTGTRFST